jgi:ABC-2 type transport system ATP-binding protein
MVIRTEKLTKFYGKSRGIENINLSVKEGEVFGFFGVFLRHGMLNLPEHC